MNKDLKKSASKMLARATELGLTSKTGGTLVTDIMEELIAAAEGFRNAHAYRAALVTREKPALAQQNPDEANNDYKLVEGKGCWISMGLFAVHPYLTDEGIVVDVFAGSAEQDSLSSTYAFNSDAEEELFEYHDVDPDVVAKWVALHGSQSEHNFEAGSSVERCGWMKRYLLSLKEDGSANASELSAALTTAVTTASGLSAVREDIVEALVEDVRMRARKHEFSFQGSLEARKGLVQESDEVLSLAATPEEIFTAANKLE